MKKSILLIVVIAAALFGCKEQQQVTKYTYDDVYSSRQDHTKNTPKQKIQDEDLSVARQTVTPDSSASLDAQSATTGEDLSDNSYTSRIKRFHDKNPGLNYTDEYYSSSGDSSQSEESSPSVNLYFGNDWCSSLWWPSYSYGWGSYYWGYPYSWYWHYPYYWYSPYSYYWGYPYSWGYPYYYGYYPYSYGYWDYPYWGGNGYNWDGHYNQHYYGQRRTLSSTDGTRNLRTNETGPTSNSITVKNPRTDLTSGKTDQISGQSRSGKSEFYSSPDQQKYRYSRSGSFEKNSRLGKDNTGKWSRSDKSFAQRQQPTPKYVKPGSETNSRSSSAQSYTSPSYRQPKSSQEYITPRAQQNQTSGVKQNPGTRSGATQPSSGRVYSSPSNKNSGYRNYPNNSGSNRTYSTPQRTHSTPGNSSPTRSPGSGYTSPSRSSSPGYSAPSRSSSPGYSSPSRSSSPGYSAPSRSSSPSNSGSSSGTSGRRR